MMPDRLNAFRPMLEGRKILLGVCGSISAYKTPELVSWLVKLGAQVRVILSPEAHRFVAPLALETMSHHPVVQSYWDGTGQGTHHIDHARFGEVFLVAPCSAEMLAEMARGGASNLLSGELLAYLGSVFVAPAMNPAMWAHPAVQDNVTRLRGYGHQFIGPDIGEMACLETGTGRLAEATVIIEALAVHFRSVQLRDMQPKRPWAGRKALVLLGPTEARLDPVRHLTNRSSGKMGEAIAWALWNQGAEVEVLHGHAHPNLPPQTHATYTPTARQMIDVAQMRAPSFDAVWNVAALLDWDLETSPTKIKREQNPRGPALEFRSTPDLLRSLSEARGKNRLPYLIGFAAETEASPSLGLEKLKRKGIDALFWNWVGANGERAFEQDTNAGVLWVGERSTTFAEQSKSALGSELVRLVGSELGARRS